MARVNRRTARVVPKTHGATETVKLTPEQTLRRSVMSTFLWEDNYYESGESNATRISKLVPKVDPQDVSNIAIEARTKMGLRHVPLHLTREMARHDTHRPYVRNTIGQVVKRADEMPELLSLYWREGKEPIAAQVKKGLADVFPRFDAYQLAKYNRDNPIKLRDVMFLAHPKPTSDEQAETWSKLIDGTLEPPDTWEVGASAGEDQKALFERLMREKKLGYVALIKNMRNMHKAGVDKELVRQTLINHKGRKHVFPYQFIQAAGMCPEWADILEEGMMSSLAARDKIPGKTVLIVDISGSMHASLGGNSGRDPRGRGTVSKASRQKIAAALAGMIKEVCEEAVVYVTAGNDWERKHSTGKVEGRGFELIRKIERDENRTHGGGGIFLVQCMDYVGRKESNTADRTIVITDEQDTSGTKLNPDDSNAFGKKNYLLNVSNYENGIGYGDKWVHIDGFSEGIIDYIIEYEKAGF